MQQVDHCYHTQIGKIPFDKSVIFIKYLQDNVPEGVSFHMELVRK